MIHNRTISQVPVNVSSMNKSDCFILDGGKDHPILVYMPAGARKMEQFRAVQVANEIRDEDHAGNAEVEVIGNKSSIFITDLVTTLIQIGFLITWINSLRCLVLDLLMKFLREVMMMQQQRKKIAGESLGFKRHFRNNSTPIIER